MRSMKLLLVEDDPGHQYLLSRAIEKNRPHVDVRTVGTRDEFVMAVQESAYDCVLLDYNISPTCQAHELIETLRNHQPDCPAIVVSGSDEQYVVVESLRHGGTDFVHKDDAIDGEELWNRVESAIAQRNVQRIERRRQQRREARLLEIAEHDPLTGLPNRRAVDRYFVRNGRRTIDRRGETSVIMVDIDFFKKVNDTYGHAAGDLVLKHVATVLASSTRKRDLVARMGGEEFLLIRPRMGLAAAMRWADKARQEIERSVMREGSHQIRVTASFGVYTTASSDIDSESIVRADLALYHAKDSGRNRVHSWELAAFARAAKKAYAPSPHDKLGEILSILSSKMGSHQREHVEDHSIRVARTSEEIARKAGYDETVCFNLRLAGLCHDLGKLAVPDQVLGKNGALLPDEVYLLRRHAADGALMARQLGVNEDVARLVHNHHHPFEKAQTNGDPPPGGDGVLAVADAFVAMTSHRAYHPAMTREQALEELQRHAGSQFDPKIVDVAMDVL